MRCQQIWSAACRELPLPFKLGFAAGAATFGALCHTRKQPGVSMEPVALHPMPIFVCLCVALLLAWAWKRFRGQ